MFRVVKNPNVKLAKNFTFPELSKPWSVPSPNIKVENNENPFTNMPNPLFQQRLRKSSHLKGVIAPVQTYFNTHRHFHKRSRVYSCEFFVLQYFPPQHYMAMFRKSSPAINTHITLKGKAAAPYNDTLSVKVDPKDHLIPQSFAHIRSNTRRVYKELMYNEYLKLSNAKDGFYLYQVVKIAEESEFKTLKSHISRSVNAVANMDHQTLEQFASDINSKLNLKKFNACLRDQGIPFSLVNSIKI